MKLYLIPSPESVTYIGGFTRTDSKINKITDDSLGKDEFEFFAADEITIKASSESGFFYAEQMLEQIKYQCSVNMPRVVIRDAPRYEYRSFMIDCSRHFFPVKELKRLIDICSRLRYNVFHWHLTDDQGWRIESEKFPELVRLGSVRGGDSFGPLRHDRTYAAHYSKEQILQVVEYAAQRHITVVPEIDMPGHVSALLRAMPQLSCDGRSVQVKRSPGIFSDILCAGKESTYATIFELLDELCELFPGEYFHLGGDEVPKSPWKKCPDCAAAVRENSLSGFEQLHGYFINQVAEHLAEKGKTVITWNESLKGGNLSKDVIVQRWLDGARLSLQCENRLINSDMWHYYVSRPYEILPLKMIYDYEPQLCERVMGIDIPVWTEFIDNAKYLEFMCLPRFAAAAQTAWCRYKPPYREFKPQLAELYGFFGMENAASLKRADPALAKRLPRLITFYGAQSKYKAIRRLFAARNERSLGNEDK